MKEKYVLFLINFVISPYRHFRRLVISCFKHARSWSRSKRKVLTILDQLVDYCWPCPPVRVNLGDRSSWNSQNRSNTILLLFTNNKSQSESESTVFFITSVLISCN